MKFIIYCGYLNVIVYQSHLYYALVFIVLVHENSYS